MYMHIPTFSRLLISLLHSSSLTAELCWLFRVCISFIWSDSSFSLACNIPTIIIMKEKKQISGNVSFFITLRKSFSLDRLHSSRHCTISNCQQHAHTQPRHSIQATDTSCNPPRLQNRSRLTIPFSNHHRFPISPAPLTIKRHTFSLYLSIPQERERERESSSIERITNFTFITIWGQSKVRISSNARKLEERGRIG